MQQRLVPRCFVVEGEAVARGAYAVQSARTRAERVVFDCHSRTGLQRARYCRSQRVGGEHVFDIGKNQFLVLLFVVQSESYQLDYVVCRCIGLQ